MPQPSVAADPVNREHRFGVPREHLIGEVTASDRDGASSGAPTSSRTYGHGTRSVLRLNVALRQVHAGLVAVPMQVYDTGVR